MTTKLKPKKCKRCKAEFKPKKRWQWFCGAKCRVAVQNAKRAKFYRKAQRIMEAHERGAA